MVIRKPYAFFIKMFKPIHLILALLISRLIFMENSLLTFFSRYRYSSATTMETIKISKMLMGIPIILIISFMVILGIMYNKKKPTKFYIISIFLLIAVVIINFYANGLMNTISKQAVPIVKVILMHDLLFANICVETVILIALIIRGFGINIKKFDFSYDIAKIDISESDREEYELSLNLNVDETKRKGKKRIRQLKYLYHENKFIINVVLATIVGVSFLVTLITMAKISKQRSEGYVFSVDGVNFSVVKSYLINEDFKGSKITDNQLVVIKIKMNSLYETSVFLKDFNLIISRTSFKPTTYYSDDLIDIGETYNEEILDYDFNEYLLTYEIPAKYSTSSMYLEYSKNGVKTKTKIKAHSFNEEKKQMESQLGSSLEFLEPFEGISFKVNSFDLQSQYLIKYDYCISKDNCYPSKEYLKGTINQNFDKQLMRLDVEFIEDEIYDYYDFYDFFEKFGSIKYKINDEWYTQKFGFENVKSKRVSNDEYIYIGVNEEIAEASKIKLVFNMRNVIYEYTLK